MSDLFTAYENGLDRLLESLGKDHPDYNKALAFQTRLSENIEQTRLFKDTSDRRSERTEIIYELNEFARPLIGQSFSELCKVPDLPSYKVIPEIIHNGSPSLPSIYRERIVDIERIIDTSQPNIFSDNTLNSFADDINDAITRIRNSCEAEDFKVGKDAVLASLRNARVKLNLASTEYTRKGRTNKFYEGIEAGRRCLEDAIDRW